MSDVKVFWSPVQFFYVSLLSPLSPVSSYVTKCVAAFYYYVCVVLMT